MKADTFAKLVVLETLMDAEVGYFVKEHPPSPDLFREGLIARVSDLVDEIDELDAVAAARVYDAIVDFLAQLPEEDDDGTIEAALRFKRAVDRIVERGIDRRDLDQSSTWAVVLDELLEAMADEYHIAVRSNGEIRTRELARAQALLARSREAADRMLWQAGKEGQTEARNEMDRLTFAVRHRYLKPTAVDFLIRTAQRRARRYRPSTLTRIGSFVVGQLLRRQPPRAREPRAS
jgi:hypothetical protein